MMVVFHVLLATFLFADAFLWLLTRALPPEIVSNKKNGQNTLSCLLTAKGHTNCNKTRANSQLSCCLAALHKTFLNQMMHTNAQQMQ